MELTNAMNKILSMLMIFIVLVIEVLGVLDVMRVLLWLSWKAALYWQKYCQESGVEEQSGVLSSCAQCAPFPAQDTHAGLPGAIPSPENHSRDACTLHARSLLAAAAAAQEASVMSWGHGCQPLLAPCSKPPWSWRWTARPGGTQALLSVSVFLPKAGSAHTSVISDGILRVLFVFPFSSYFSSAAFAVFSMSFISSW